MELLTSVVRYEQIIVVLTTLKYDWINSLVLTDLVCLFCFSHLICHFIELNFLDFCLCLLSLVDVRLIDSNSCIAVGLEEFWNIPLIMFRNFSVSVRLVSSYLLVDQPSALIVSAVLCEWGIFWISKTCIITHVPKLLTS